MGLTHTVLSKLKPRDSNLLLLIAVNQKQWEKSICHQKKNQVFPCFKWSFWWIFIFKERNIRLFYFSPVPCNPFIFKDSSHTEMKRKKKWKENNPSLPALFKSTRVWLLVSSWRLFPLSCSNWICLILTVLVTIWLILLSMQRLYDRLPFTAIGTLCWVIW